MTVKQAANYKTLPFISFFTNVSKGHWCFPASVAGDHDLQ